MLRIFDVFLQGGGGGLFFLSRALRRKTQKIKKKVVLNYSVCPENFRIFNLIVILILQTPRLQNCCAEVLDVEV